MPKRRSLWTGNRRWRRSPLSGSIFSAVTFGAHLADEGALLPDALVARIVADAVKSVGGCWDAHGSDWVKAVFPDLAKDSDKRADMLKAWRDEDWVLVDGHH